MEKVGIINSVYEYGSTGSLAKQLYDYGTRNGYDAFAFFGRGKRSSDSHIIKLDTTLEFILHKVLTLLTGYQGIFSNIATSKLIHRLKKEKIEKVILLNLHGYYLNENRLLSYLKKNHIQTAYVTPDEYAGLGKCCYSKGCTKYKTVCEHCPRFKGYPRSLFFDRSNAVFRRKMEVYSGFDSMTLLGPESNLVVFRESALVKDKPMKRISWGVDLDLYKDETDDSLYEKYNIPRDKTYVLTVASYSNPRKGVKDYFFEIARRLQDSEYHFINVGYDGNLKPEEIPKNLTTIGYINDQKELAHLYAMSDLYVLASTADTMPVSCLISFACETPVCCFYTSGMKYLADRTNPSICFCDDISVDSLEKAVRSKGKKTKDVMSSCRKLAEDEYSTDAFCRKVYEVFQDTPHR